MRELPILFSTEMVRAILDGQKGMTRRVIKPQPDHRHRDVVFEYGKLNEYSQIAGVWHVVEQHKCPYGQPGDRLWVRETWFKNYPHQYGVYFYRADGEEIQIPTITGETMMYGKADGLKWRSPATMPKSAARIWLEVLGTRVERLQEITDVNALKEGCIGTVCKHLNRDEHGCTDCMNSGWIDPPRVEFFELWDSLNVKRGYGWDTNPWVWVISFKRIKP